ncbi:MAG: OmpA family protein [Gemmatimonadaceae bacterium]
MRKELAVQRTQIDSTFSTMNTAMATERQERTAGDDALRADLASLKSDLTMMRDSFNVKIAALDSGMQFVMPVQFAFDDATVRQEDMAVLDRFAKIVQKHYNGSKITVEGFADPAGSTRYNMSLSKRRAESVVAYLTGKGIMQESLAPIGYGEARQVVPRAQKDEPGADRNRRVVFVVESRPTGAAGNVSSAQ